MQILCTRPHCPNPVNREPQPINPKFAAHQRHCAACGMPLLLGGRYLPIKQLGSGSFGTTFLAIDLHSAYRKTKRLCVIKQLRIVFSSSLKPKQIEGVKEKFRREAEVLERLGALHKQIPSLYAYFELSVPSHHQNNLEKEKIEEYLYLVQEYVKGQDLDRIIGKQRFSEAEVLQALNQLLPVFHLVHELGVIHRDIKPGNIMRDCKGVLYLIDFGAVKEIVQEPVVKQSVVLGTPLFAAPEQIQLNPVYPSSDLYSLAVTMLCLMSDYRTIEQMFNSSNYFWNWQPYISVSHGFGNVLDKMLQRDPKRRFQSALEILEALESLPDHKLIVAKQEGKHRSLNKKSLLTVVKLSLMLGAGSYLLSVFLTHFLGLLLSMYVWLLVLVTLMFTVFDRNYSSQEKIGLFLISLFSILPVFYLSPDLLSGSISYEDFGRVLLGAISSSLICWNLILLFQFFGLMKFNRIKF